MEGEAEWRMGGGGVREDQVDGAKGGWERGGDKGEGRREREGAGERAATERGSEGGKERNPSLDS